MADNTASGGDLDKIREAIKLLPGSAFPVYEAVTQIQDEPAKHEAVKVYDGLTKEQWERVIDGGYLCEFTSKISNRKFIDRVLSILPWGGFDDEQGMGPFDHCRPIQEYGHITPHFGGPKPEWVDGSAKIVYLKDKRGFVQGGIFTFARNINWDRATEFIAIKP